MDNQKIREHVQKVSEALSTIATTSGYKRFDATERLEQNAEAWLEQSIEIIEQQQREIERLTDVVQQQAFGHEQNAYNAVEARFKKHYGHILAEHAAMKSALDWISCNEGSASLVDVAIEALSIISKEVSP